MAAAIAPADSLLPARDDLTGARLRLFETALLLFGERGYHAVSVRDLMAELGQVSGALYFHVSSKEHLLFELVRIGLEGHRDRLQEALLEAGTDPVDQARAVVEAPGGVARDFPDQAPGPNPAAPTHTGANHAGATTMRAESARILTDVVKRGVGKGVFHVADPDLAVQAIASMGIRAVEWWTPDSPQDKDHVVRTYGDYALKVLL